MKEEGNWIVPIMRGNWILKTVLDTTVDEKIEKKEKAGMVGNVKEGRYSKNNETRGPVTVGDNVLGLPVSREPLMMMRLMTE